MNDLKTTTAFCSITNNHSPSNTWYFIPRRLYHRRKQLNRQRGELVIKWLRGTKAALNGRIGAFAGTVVEAVITPLFLGSFESSLCGISE
jgi:hypothetical protein